MIKEGLIRPIDLGSAGEHLVCADLILRGLRAFQSSQGLPYDVVADLGGTMLKVAVKATETSKQREPSRGQTRQTYQFNLVRQGVDKQYRPEEVDLIACVALDIRAIAYLPVFGAPSKIHFDPPGPKIYPNLKGCRTFPDKHMASFTLDKALARWRECREFGEVARHTVNPDMLEKS